MNYVMKLPSLLVSVFLVIGIGACTAGKVTVQWPQDEIHGYPDSGINKPKGPPPHAPAHGYRAKYGYQYYPEAYVYYDTSNRVYFYLDSGNWVVGVDLPERIRVRLGDFVTVQLETDKPYTHFAEHLTMYPPSQYKKKNQKKEKRKK